MLVVSWLVFECAGWDVFGDESIGWTELLTEPPLSDRLENGVCRARELKKGEDEDRS